MKRNYKLRELKDALMAFFTFLQVVSYIGSVLMSWFYFENKPLAIAIAISLTISHAVIEIKSYVKRKLIEIIEEIEKD